MWENGGGAVIVCFESGIDSEAAMCDDDATTYCHYINLFYDSPGHRRRGSPSFMDDPYQPTIVVVDPCHMLTGTCHRPFQHLSAMTARGRPTH